MKKLRYTFFLVVIIGFSFSVHAQQTKYSKIKIYAQSGDLKKIAGLGLPLDFGVTYRNNELTGEFSQNDINKLIKAGVKYEIITDDMSKFYSQRNKKSTQLFKTSKTPANFHLGSFLGNLSLSEMITELETMKTLYPNLISAQMSIDQTITTHEGEQVFYVKLSDNPETDEEEPEVLYTALTHAREPVGMMQLIYYMWYLLENYDTDPEIKYLLDNTEMYFVPCVNPDGYEYNHAEYLADRDYMWRKNRRNNGDGTFGVDINRNYGFQWHFDDSGSSSYPSDETYRGPSAFSEPETQMMRNFTVGRNFLAANNHHTYSNLLLYPFGYDEIQAPDSLIFKTYAALMARHNGFSTGTAWELLYSTNGDANDWMYGEQTTKNKIYSFTAETGNSTQGFWPDSEDILPLCENNLEMNLYLTRFVSVFAQITDKSETIIPNSGQISFDLQRLGLSGNGTYSVSLSSNDDIFETIGANVEIELPNVLDSQTGTIDYLLKSSVANGSTVNMILTVTNGEYSVSESLSKIIGVAEIIVSEDGNSMTDWTTSQWNITSSSYVSPGFSITDSPAGNYYDNTNNPITLTSPVDLSGVTYAALSFQAHWDIENDWDCVRLLVSENNGSTWSPIQGKYTNPGADQGEQIAGEPLYDGTMTNWVLEDINLQNFLNKTLKFRFELKSDGYVTKDGFYFDDFKIVTLAPTVSTEEIENSEVKIYPNPNRGLFNISIKNNSNFNRLEITDISGKLILEQKILNINEIKDIKIEKGIYFVSLIKENNKKFTQKLVIY